MNPVEYLIYLLGRLADALRGQPVTPPPVDGTAPTVVLTASALNFAANGTLVLTTSASDNAPGPLTVTLTRQAAGGTPVALTLAPDGTFSEGITRSANGTYTYTLTATDAAGNPRSQSVTVTVDIAAPDTAAPTLTLSASPNPLTSDGQVTLLAEAADNVGVAGVVFRRLLPNPAPLGTVTAPPYTITDPTNLTTADNGTRTYSASAYDGADNYSAAVEASVTVNIPAAPLATLTSDGDAFTLTWPSSASLQYVVYSAYAPTGRMYVPVSGLITGTSFTDPNVYDGRSVWYQVWRIVDGVEVLHATLNGTQPARTWESGVTLPPGTYTNRNFRSLSASANDVTLSNNQSGTQMYTFINCRFAGMKHAVAGFGQRVTMRGCRVWRLHPGGTGKQHGHGLDLQNFRHADIQHCYFEDTQSNYFTQQDNRASAADTLLFKYNFIRNVVGMLTDGAGGYKTGQEDYIRSQAWQVSRCYPGQVDNSQNPPLAQTWITGLRGAEIMYNYVSNEPFYSRVEDASSMYQTWGFADSKVKVWNNLFDGAFTYRPDTHTGFSGGGTMIGDEGGNYITQRYNRIIRFSNYGHAILNGHDNESSNNRAVRSPFLWDGRRNAVAPPSGLVAAQMWDYNNAGSAMRDNQMNDNYHANQYQKADGTLVTNNKFVPLAGQNGNTYTGNTDFTGNVTVAMEWAEVAAWRAEMNAAGRVFGPQGHV